MKKDIVSFGELLLRLNAPSGELLLQSGRLNVHVGGAEANVAVALALLGHQAAMVSRVPANPLGDAAIGHLRRYGVATENVSRGLGRMGLYFATAGDGARPSSIVYDRDGSSFALANSEDFAWDHLLLGAKLLHLSGITPALGDRSAEIALAAARAASAAGARVSFDGNYRRQLWDKRGGDPRAVLSQLVARADIFFGNHQDIALLLGMEFDSVGEVRREQAAQAALQAFPNLQLIASTSRNIDAAGQHHLAARIDTRDGSAQTEEVVLSSVTDRIGAGDAFAAGVLHGVLGNRDIEESVRIGLALACLKHGLPGDASLFAQADIDAFLAGERDVRR